AAEAAGTPEARHLIDRTEYRLVVGGDLVEAGPGSLDAGPLQRGQAVEADFGDPLQEALVDLGREGRPLIPVAHAEKYAVTFGVEVEAGREVDCHGRVAADLRQLIGHPDMAPVRVDRDVDARQQPDRLCPGAGAVEHDACRDLAQARAKTAHPAPADVDRVD